MKSYLTVSCYAGNYRARAYRNAPRPSAFARGIFGSRKQAERHATALADHYGQTGPESHVMYFALEYETALRRYSLSV